MTNVQAHNLARGRVSILQLITVNWIPRKSQDEWCAQRTF